MEGNKSEKEVSEKEVTKKEEVDTVTRTVTRMPTNTFSEAMWKAKSLPWSPGSSDRNEGSIGKGSSGRKEGICRKRSERRQNKTS